MISKKLSAGSFTRPPPLQVVAHIACTEHDRRVIHDEHLRRRFGKIRYKARLRLHAPEAYGNGRAERANADLCDWRVSRSTVSPSFAK